jgi:xylitol oxidase
VKNWAGNIEFQDGKTLAPKSIAEIQNIVRTNPKVRARGTAHCFNTIADTKYVALVLDQMPKEIIINKEKKSVTVSAGLKYGEVAEELHKNGWALHNLASLPHISIAGAIATGTHGSGTNNGSLATAVKSFDVVLADGSLRNVNSSDGDLYYGGVIALGLVGIVVRMELEIRPTYNLGQSVYLGMKRDNFRDNFDAIMSSGYSVSYVTTWQQEIAGEVWVKFLEGRTPPEVLFGSHCATEKLHLLKNHSPEPCNDQLGIMGPWHLRLPHFKMEFTPSSGTELQSEFFVNKAQASSVLLALEAIADQISIPLMASEIRTIASDNFWMSPQYKSDDVGLHFTWKQVPETFEAVKAIEATLEPFKYRPHLGKVYTATPSYISLAFPKFKNFKELISQIDPQNKFGNEMTEGLFQLN